MTIEEVLSAEETQIFDRKSIHIDPKALAIPIIAFANADGGTAALGISDKTRRVEGIDAEPGKVNVLLRVPFDFCVQKVHAEEEKEGFWELQNACVSALAVYHGPQTLEILKKETSSKNWNDRRNAAKSLAVLNTDRDALADILQGNDRYAKEMLEYQLDAVKAQRRAGL